MQSGSRSGHYEHPLSHAALRLRHARAAQLPVAGLPAFPGQEVLNPSAVHVVPMQNAPSGRPARLAIVTLPTLGHFVPDLARALPVPGILDVEVFELRAPADMGAILAWTDGPGDMVWFEFCWPPFPDLINTTDFGHRRVMVRVHRIEAYERDFGARTDWSHVHDLIVVSSDMARVVREMVPCIEYLLRLHVIHNGVDMSRVVPLADFNKYRIGWCGNFILRKNPTLALAILHELRLQDPHHTLHVAAVAADRITTESFRHQAQALGLSEAVHFDGKISAADMPAWHARNGVLLSTSLHESFGYAIAEAAAAGCDIAVLDHAGAEEFWPAETRFVRVSDAVCMIRESRPHRWRGLIAERFSLQRQVAALHAILGAEQPCLAA
jgi:glycosyltransferase involved in cell wall biosynthesis